jgi:hypothetical protein
VERVEWIEEIERVEGFEGSSLSVTSWMAAPMSQMRTSMPASLIPVFVASCKFRVWGVSYFRVQGLVFSV